MLITNVVGSEIPYIPQPLPPLPPLPPLLHSPVNKEVAMVRLSLLVVMAEFTFSVQL